jgi:glycosyltransferase involved in cell wall biosynthesis
MIPEVQIAPHLHGKKIVIYSTCQDDWGGSEELWSRSIPYLNKGGKEVFVFKEKINESHPAFLRLKNDYHVHLKEVRPGYTQRIRSRIGRLLSPAQRTSHRRIPENLATENFFRALKKVRPELAIISQAINFDGLIFALQCLKLNIPYVIISHKAVDFYWPDYRDRDYMTLVWKKALQCFFVSRHNLRLTEQQFGFSLSNSQVVINPMKVSLTPVKYPSTSDGFRLACVGRLFLLDKGQDILLRILALDKWRKRPLEVTFIGAGVDYAGLTALKDYLQLNQVRFAGYREAGQIWSHYHGLILPSRSEGMPLVIMEAMAAGRMAIVTRAGGNAELVEDEVTGFTSEVNERDFDQAMERAWCRRADWEDIGLKASRSIRRMVPGVPEEEFVQNLNTLLYGTH